jgi:hypothetical protein
MQLWRRTAIRNPGLEASEGLALTRDETLGGNDRHHAPLHFGLENKSQDHMSGGKERDGM